MFKKIRQPGRAKSIAAYIIFSLICLVFIFLGVPIEPLSGVGGFAALVNKQVISIADFNQRLNIAQQNQEPASRNNAEQQKEFRNLVLNQLINEKLMTQNTEQEGGWTCDEELSQFIRSQPVFQENGVFQNSLYSSYLQANRLSSAEFEEKFRSWALIGRIEKLFSKIFLTSQIEKKRNQELDRVQLKLKYITIPLTQFSSYEEDIKKWQNLVTQPNLLEKEIKKRNLDWISSSKSSLRNLNQILPLVQDEDQLFKILIQKIPKKGIAPQLIIQSDSVTIVQVSHFEIKKTQILPDSKGVSQDVLSFATSRMIFSSWIQSLKDQSQIKINPKII